LSVEAVLATTENRKESVNSSEDQMFTKLSRRTTNEFPVYWPSNYVRPYAPTATCINCFESVLTDASDEAPLQKVFASAPVLLRSLLPRSPHFWCFDRPKLGAEFIPDFLICQHNSTGFNWTAIELESPTATVFTQGGRPAKKLNEAMAQVRDWRIWLRNNIAYAQSELGFKGLTDEFHAWIIIGRRASMPVAHAKRYRELSNGGLTVLTYDRLMESSIAARRKG
jgi:hypothetical protein